MEADLRQARIRRFEELCRQHGLSQTVQRRAIFEVLLDREDHPTADQVYDLVLGRVPGVSRTTVYRVLETLVDIGVISKVAHPGAAVRFDPKIHQHHHLVCVQCERVTDLESEQLNSLVLPAVETGGFDVREFHIHLRGVCPECRAKQTGGRRKNAGAKKSRKGRVARPRKKATPKRNRRKPS